MTARVRAGWKKFKELSGVLCAKDWPLILKGRVYRTCMRTVATYGSETWALKKDDKAVLKRVERAMIRRICGVS